MPGESSEVEASRGRSGWRQAVTDPSVAATVLYAAIALAAAIASYYAIFSIFQGYDDEGTLLVSLKAFAGGETLYRDVYTPYGPFYYEAFGGLFSLTGLAITTEASRWITIVVWVGSSLLFGLGAQRLSGSLLLGGAAMIVAYLPLGILVNEPMHPHGLATLMIALFGLLAVLGPGEGRPWRGALAGALLGALVLTKVNLGGFAVAAAVLAAVLAVEPLSRLHWLRWIVAAAFLAMPLVVLQRDLDVPQTRNLFTVEMLSMAALLVAAWRRPEVPKGGDGPMLRWLRAAAGGLGAAMLAIVAVIFLLGVSPADLYDGAIGEALRVRDVLKLYQAVSDTAIVWAVATLAAAILTAWLGRRRGSGPSLWPGVLRALAGLAIWYSITGLAPIGPEPTVERQLVVPMLLAWVAAAAPAGAAEPAWRRFARVLFPALALGEVLQVYPVAGSQTGIAAVLFVPVGAICLGDAVVGLRAWSEARGGIAARRLGIAVWVLSAALLVQLGVEGIGRSARSHRQAYLNQQALRLPGAEALHLPAPQAVSYERLVALLREHGCTDLIGYPNINSLYLWSGIEPPPPVAPGAWIKALDRERQQRIVDELRASPRPCAILDSTQAGAWQVGAVPPDLPLVNYVLDDFTPIIRLGQFEFAVPKGSGR